MESRTAPGTASIWVYASIGLAAGMLSGLLGVGGGIILVPLLVGVVGLDQHRAHATSLAAILVIALTGAIRLGVAGEVDWAVGALVGIGAITGSTFGSRLMGRMSPRLLRGVFVVVLTVAAIRMLTGGDIALGTGMEAFVAGVVAVAVGLLAGFAGALAGIGGGVIIVPSLVFFLGIEQHTASGTSLMAIVFTALAATRVNWQAGRVDLRQAFTVGGAGVISALLGSSLALALDGALLTRIFGGFALLVAIRMALSLRSAPRPPR